MTQLKTINDDATTPRENRLQCMELRGGNGLVEEAFAMPGLDVWVLSRPYHQASGGGDVHYVSTCATGRIARVLVADVSGHGADVSKVAWMLRDLMEKYVNFLDQRRFFRAMNRRFAELAHGGQFATAVVATYFAPTYTLSVSNAGHPPPLIWCAATGRWSFLEQAAESPEARRGKNLPLGVIDAARYDRFDRTLERGDLVLVYTDSLSESRGTDGELLSMDGLLRVAEGIDGGIPGRVIPAFVAALEKLSSRNLLEDDVTLLLFRSNDGHVRVPLRDRLMAPMRVVAGVLRGLLPGGRPMPWPEPSLANLGGAVYDPLSRLWGRRR